MSSDFTLPRYANGDTDYVSKMDNTQDLVETAIRMLQDSNGGAMLGVLSFLYLLQALFNSDPVLIGYGSYACTGSGATLSVAAGYAWKPSTQVVVQWAGLGSLDFTGQSAGTYYLAIDGTGTPSFTASSAEAYYSIVWTGSAFGAITRIAECFMTADDEQALLHSTYLGIDYLTLLARLEAIETSIGGGGGGSPVFVDDEIVSGSGTSWTLAYTPSPVASLQVFQDLSGFGEIKLKRGVDYTLAGGTGPGFTTTNSLGSGALHAFYRK